MHIPTIATSEMEVLSFTEAMRQSGREADYDTDRWLYVPDFYTEYRYVLGTKGKKPLICIGVNPSTAEPDNLDNTLKSVERIALGNGYDSFIMFNVYPQRATRPQDMAKERDERLHRANMEAFEYILGLSEEPTVWAAWGNNIATRPYLKESLKRIIEIADKYNCRWLKAEDENKSGHPHHPTRLRSGAKLVDFNIKKYYKEIWGS